eukprot:gene3455-5917_t
MAMLKVRFNGILARGGEHRSLLRICRGGGWGHFRARKNGKCILCGKDSPTMTHVLTRCPKQEERYREKVTNILERAGIEAENRRKIMKLLGRQKKRLVTMLGVLPDEYYEELSGTRGERWKQGAKAAEALAWLSMEMLQKYRMQVREESSKRMETQMDCDAGQRKRGHWQQLRCFDSIYVIRTTISKPPRTAISKPSDTNHEAHFGSFTWAKESCWFSDLAPVTLTVTDGSLNFDDNMHVLRLRTQCV